MARHSPRRRPAVPASMRAAAIDRFGPPSALRLHEVPVPKLDSDEVLLAITSAGVGVWDGAIRKGEWRRPGRTKFPLIPGVDGAGVVVAKGSRVRRFRLGDLLYAYEFGNPKGGFYAEYVAVHARYAARVPKSVDLVEAGALATTGLTALQGVDRLRLGRGATVLIFGATGAVGTIAVQLAKQRGHRVIGTASGASATRLLRRLGARAVFDARKKKDMAERLRALAPDGLDAVLALAGGKQLERCLDFLKPGGRVVCPNGVEPAPKPRPRIRIQSYDGVPNPENFAALGRRIAAKRLRVPIAAQYPLSQAALAHRRLEKGQVIGRIVLRVRR